jgi:hypothetical protein
LIVALIFGSFAYLLCAHQLQARQFYAGDFTWLWRAGQVLLSGHNPYHNPEFLTGNVYPFDQPLVYPLPAVLFTLPFSFLSPYQAGALFFGISSGLLAFGITRDGFYRLPVFFSAPFFVAACVAQWSPLLMAAFFLPALPILAIKPNIALPIISTKPHWKSICVSIVVCAASLIILPLWPWDMLQNIRQYHHPIPLLVMPGPLLLLALLCWRDVRARVLLILAIIPQVIRWYDQLYLWFIPRTAWQSIALTVASWIGYIFWYGFHQGSLLRAIFGYHQDINSWVICSVYLPALTLVLWQARASLVSFRLPGARTETSCSPAPSAASPTGLSQVLGRLRQWPVVLNTWRAPRTD